MEQKGKRPPVEVNKEIREEYSDADIHKMAIQMVRAMKDKETIKEEAKIAADSLKQNLAAKDHQLDLEDAEAANKAELERITKEENEKKTAELNAAAQKANEEENAKKV